jgi:hypothetical protein
MKKIVALLLALVMVMGFAACGSDSAAIGVMDPLDEVFETSGGWIVIEANGSMMTLENRDCHLSVMAVLDTEYAVGDRISGRYSELANGQIMVTGQLQREFMVIGCHKFGDLS